MRNSSGHDVEKKRASDHAFYLRHRQEINFQQKRTRYWKEYNHRRTTWAREEMDAVFGQSCKICGKTSFLALHEINFQDHTRAGPFARARFYLANRGNFIRLCKSCHETIHALRRLSPEQKSKLLSLVENNRLVTLQQLSLAH
jgi:hypothetical protein